MIWEEVPTIDENGIIVNYEVQIEPLDFTEVLTNIFVNTTFLSTRTVVSGLQEFVRYNISVRAYTSLGPGPFSPTVTERTFEDGIYMMHVCIAMYLHKFSIPLFSIFRARNPSSECSDRSPLIHCDHGDLGEGFCN